MEENKITTTNETGEKTVVWENAPFFLKVTLLFAAFYVFCLYDNPAGITYPLFTAGLLGLYVCFLKKEGWKLKRSSVFYMAAIFLLGLSNCLTDNDMILWFNRPVSFLLYGMLFLHNSYEDERWSFLKYAGSFVEFGLSVLAQLPAVFRTGIRMNTARKAKSMKVKKDSKALYVILGLLIAFLLLFIILPLLAFADRNFEALLDQIFRAFFINISLPDHLFGMIMMFCWGFVFFFALLSAVQKKTIREEQKELRNLEPVLAITCLTVIGIVYLVFCLIQISYLFTGGLALPEAYTYSSFAREGFFQLLFVSALNLGLVLFCLELFRSHKALKILLIFISVCTYIMMISSACRMYLYVQAYGLTRLRVLVLAALLALALILGGMIYSIFRENFPLFRFSAVVITVVYLILALGRMDLWIAKYNISQNGLDITDENTYLMHLSADAAGVFEDAVEKDVARTELADDMLRDYFRRQELYADMEIREFHLSRYLAVRAVEDYFQIR